MLAAACATSRLSVSAVAIRPSSSGLAKPYHHSFFGQISGLEGADAENETGSSVGFSAWGTGVAQPAATRANATTETRVDNFAIQSTCDLSMPGSESGMDDVPGGGDGGEDGLGGWRCAVHGPQGELSG